MECNFSEKEVDFKDEVKLKNHHITKKEKEKENISLTYLRMIIQNKGEIKDDVIQAK